MTITHHPSDTLLAAYAAGKLDQGCNALMATHLLSCTACRALTRSLEDVGGTLLDDISPSPLALDALARVGAMLDEDGTKESATPAGFDNLPEIPTLPAFLRAARVGRWHWIAPGLHRRRIALDHAGATRVFLLRSRPGAKFLAHSHTGLEMTCVLTGSFSHDTGCFGPGDFDLGDREVDHRIEIGPDEPCVSLVAMQGRLGLHGALGKLMQPLLFI